MATPAYVPFDSLQPVVTSTRQIAIDKSRTNLLALRDAVVSGRIAGWTLATAGGTAEEPASKSWTNGTERIVAGITWSGGYITQVVWDWSNDSGVSYSRICTETANYDGSGNMTTGNNSSWLSWFYEVMGKVKASRNSIAAHIAGVGTAVHGLGSMSTQNANAVAITGGTAYFQSEREAVYTNGALASAIAISWPAVGACNLGITGAGAQITHTGLPNGVLGFMTFRVNSAVVPTLLFPGVKWPGGAVPLFTLGGVDLVTLMCLDGATIYGSFLKDLK